MPYEELEAIRQLVMFLAEQCKPVGDKENIQLEKLKEKMNEIHDFYYG